MCEFCMYVKLMNSLVLNTGGLTSYSKYLAEDYFISTALWNKYAYGYACYDVGINQFIMYNQGMEVAVEYLTSITKSWSSISEVLHEKNSKVCNNV